jgi:hypothetical protein
MAAVMPLLHALPNWHYSLVTDREGSETTLTVCCEHECRGCLSIALHVMDELLGAGCV